MQLKIESNIYQNQYSDDYILHIECDSIHCSEIFKQHYISISSEIRFKPILLNEYIWNNLKYLDCFKKDCHKKEFNNTMDSFLKE